MKALAAALLISAALWERHIKSGARSNNRLDRRFTYQHPRKQKGQLIIAPHD